MTKTTNIICSVIAALTLTISNAQQFELDTENSILDWTGYAEVGDYSQSGTLKPSSGKMTLVNNELTELEVIVNMKSLKHADAELENHLKQKDFFHVKKFPEATMTFKDEENEDFFFELTIRGITQTLVLPVILEKTASGYTAVGNVTIDRTKFDIKYNSSSYFQDLGSYAIKNELDLEYRLVFRES